MKKLLLIDGHSLLHRAFHALPEFTSPQGEPVGAVYGFARMLLTALKELSPDSVIIAWDTAAPTFRHQQYAEYKQHRPETDKTLRQQIGMTQGLVESFGIEQFAVEGYEADDIIATVIQSYKRLHSNDCSIEVLTSDTDMLQLVEDGVCVLAVKKGISELKRFDTDAVVEKYSLTPEQLPDLKGLMGDSSDNIPGVTGVGIKTATKLLTDYGDLDGVYEHVGEITGKAQELLIHQHEMAVLSKELGTIRDDAPITLEQDAEYNFIVDTDEVLKQFQMYGFKSLVPLVMEFQTENPVVKEEAVTKEMFFVQDDLDGFKEEASVSSRCYVAVSAEGADILFYFGDGPIWSITADALLQDEPVRKSIEKEIVDVVLVGADIKNIMHVFDRYEIQIDEFFDVLLVDVLLQRGKGAKNVQEALFNYLGVVFETTKDTLTIDQIQTVLVQMPKLYDELKKGLDSSDESTKQIANNIEIPLVKILFEIEKHGVLIDKDRLTNIHKKLIAQKESLEHDIYEDIGHEINLNSPKQLEVVLFDELKLPVVKRTKTQRSTNEAVLKQLSHAHPVVQKILDYRGVSKLTSTYTEALAAEADNTSRIHTTYNQLKVVTSRLSSENPNLQNIPRDKETKIRSVFVAPEGSKLIALDYSQIELRILAHLSGDSHLQDSFKAGQDIHTATAAKLFDTFVDEINDRQRQIAKVVNFAVMYGMGPHALSESLDIEFVEAKKYIEDFFEFYPDVQKWRDTIITFAKDRGYVETLWGRQIEVSDIRSANKRLIAAGERMATNYPNQGTQADLIKKAMVEIGEQINDDQSSNIHMIMQVHDELVFEVPEDKVAETIDSYKQIMEEVITLDVPVVVDCKVGDNWLEMEHV